MRVMINMLLRGHVKPALKQLHWLPVEQRITYKLCLFMHYIHIGLAPKYLSDCVSTVSAKNKNKIWRMWLLLLWSSHLEYSYIQPSWHYWYEYIQKTTRVYFMIVLIT